MLHFMIMYIVQIYSHGSTSWILGNVATSISLLPPTSRSEEKRKIWKIIILNKNMIDLQYCVVSDIQQSDLYVYNMYIHVYIFFLRLFSMIGYYKILNIVPLLYSKSLLFIYFIYSEKWKC